MAEFRITVALTEHGRDAVAEETCARMLDAFTEVHPEVGAAVGANLKAGWLEVTFSLDAADPNRAFDRGKPIFAEGLAASGLEPTPIARIEVENVSAELEPELLTA